LTSSEREEVVNNIDYDTRYRQLSQLKATELTAGIDFEMWEMAIHQIELASTAHAADKTFNSTPRWRFNNRNIDR
jgi:hypothetical protein